MGRKKTYNEDYFKTIDTPNKAYFLGFIFADGCVVSDDKTYRHKMILKIHPKDEHILEQLITEIEGEICQVALSGKKIVEDLKSNGCGVNKTFTIEYPNIPEELERHFLRGYFDGDGCIRVNTDKRDGSKRGDLRIVGGSEKMINKINERMNILFGTNINKLYGPKGGKYKFIGWAGMSDIEKIYEGFYRGTDLFLNRKKLIFDEVIDIIKNKQKYRKK